MYRGHQEGQRGEFVTLLNSVTQVPYANAGNLKSKKHVCTNVPMGVIRSGGGSMKIISLFNNKGGVGKTTLSYPIKRGH